MPATTLKPKPSWPRPQLVHDHRQLFVQPVYEDGQVYADDSDDDLEDDD